MNEAKCPECGDAMNPSAAGGLCPKCLMAVNMASQTDMTGDRAEDQGSTGRSPSLKPVLEPSAIAGYFPQFEVIQLLGRGGMGVVYKARQKSLDRFVALKIIAPEREKDRQFAERFTSEAKILAKMSHANIVTVHDFGEVGGMFYLVMEYVDGVNLRQLLHQRKLSPEEALAIVPAICEALEYAHKQGVVHRDIKPENLMFDTEGQVKIADFGIAKIVGGTERSQSSPATGSFEPAGLTQDARIGTPSYMAPEQVERPTQVDHRADIYSLGIVFYEMLTGERPGAKLQPPSNKVRVDVRIDEAVIRALENDPELRYQTAAQFKTAIDTAVRGETSLSGRLDRRSWSPAHSLGDRKIRAHLNRFWKWWFGCAALIVLATALWGMWLQREIPLGQGVSAESPDGMFLATVQTTHAMRILDSDIVRYRFRVQGHGGSVSERWAIPVPIEALAKDYLLMSLDSIVFGSHGTIIWSKDGKRVSFRMGEIEVDAFNTEDGSHSFQEGFLPPQEVELQANVMLQNRFLDLDTGQVLSPPAELVSKLGGGIYAQIIPQYWEWMNQRGVDIVYRPSQEGSTTGVHGHLTLVEGVAIKKEAGGPRGDSRAFDTVSTSEVEDSIRALKNALVHNADPYPNFGVSFPDVSLVETREGGMAVIEIMAGNPSPEKIRLRYKLVKNETRGQEPIIQGN